MRTYTLKTEKEKLAWERADQADSIKAYKQFLRRYPGTSLKEVVQRRLVHLQKEEVDHKNSQSSASQPIAEKINRKEKALDNPFNRKKAFKVPKIQIPSIRLPKIQVPSINVPSIRIPSIQMPKVQVPRIPVPKIPAYRIRMPRIQQYFTSYIQTMRSPQTLVWGGSLSLFLLVSLSFLMKEDSSIQHGVVKMEVLSGYSSIYRQTTRDANAAVLAEDLSMKLTIQKGETEVIYKIKNGIGPFQVILSKGIKVLERFAQEEPGEGKFDITSLLNSPGKYSIFVIDSSGDRVQQEKHFSIAPKMGLVKDPVGKAYKTMIIDELEWTIENIDYELISGSKPYQRNKKNRQDYGLLYNWEAAREACAELGAGWRLPDTQDWQNLMASTGEIRPSGIYDALLEGGDSRFGIVLGGYQQNSGGRSFLGLGEVGQYWANDMEGRKQTSVFNSIGFRERNITKDYFNRNALLSCRCVKNN